MKHLSLDLSVLPGRWAVCRLPAEAPVPDWALAGAWFSVTRTADELSIVCAEEAAPAVVAAERGWRAVKVAGPLDFSLVGILAALTGPLALAGVSVFAVSTYDTDYLLVKAAQLSAALEAWRAAGHQITE
ncbi:MAG: ACT domain-containing protein [Anaerolineales bacterium]|nr:ACT domain-containing protein [Anaerolineales bacterium]